MILQVIFPPGEIWQVPDQIPQLDPTLPQFSYKKNIINDVGSQCPLLQLEGVWGVITWAESGIGVALKYKNLMHACKVSYVPDSATL